MKKNRNNSGRNIFGDACATKKIVLEKENALAQYMKVLDDLERHKRMNINLEYDVVFPKEVFTDEEIDELYAQIKKIMMLRAGIIKTNFVEIQAPIFPMMNV